jgi:hypothetical protein
MKTLATPLGWDHAKALTVDGPHTTMTASQAHLLPWSPLRFLVAAKESIQRCSRFVGVYHGRTGWAIADCQQHSREWLPVVRQYGSPRTRIYRIVTSAPPPNDAVALPSAILCCCCTPGSSTPDATASGCVATSLLQALGRCGLVRVPRWKATKRTHFVLGVFRRKILRCRIRRNPAPSAKSALVHNGKG